MGCRPRPSARRRPGRCICLIATSLTLSFSMPVRIGETERISRWYRMTVASLSRSSWSAIGAAARLRPWALGAVLLLPVFSICIAHFALMAAPGTGFLQYDQAYYMANARAYFADGGFAPVYGL